jgi:hypothetical protein
VKAKVKDKGDQKSIRKKLFGEGDFLNDICLYQYLIPGFQHYYFDF